MLDLAIIVPVCNEASNIPIFINRVIQALRPLGLQFNIVFVTDENQDATVPVLKDMILFEPCVKAIKLTRRRGQHIAIIAGLRNVDSKYYVIMDGDLQDYPEDIPRLYQEAISSGFDVIYGLKSNKNSSFIRNLLSRSFYGLMNILSGVKIDKNASMFRIVTRRVVVEILCYHEHEPSLIYLMSLINFPASSISVTSGERAKGKTNYSISRLINLSLDHIISFSNKPLRLISNIGIAISLCSFLFILYMVFLRVFVNKAPEGWVTIIVTMLFLGGLQLLAIGVVGEYLGKMFLETKNRPLYTIEEMIGAWDNINTDLCQEREG